MQQVKRQDLQNAKFHNVHNSCEVFRAELCSTMCEIRANAILDFPGLDVHF